MDLITHESSEVIQPNLPYTIFDEDVFKVVKDPETIFGPSLNIIDCSDKIIAHCSYRVTDRSIEWCKYDYVFVDPTYRGEGLCRQMFWASLACAKRDWNSSHPDLADEMYLPIITRINQESVVGFERWLREGIGLSYKNFSRKKEFNPDQRYESKSWKEEDTVWIYTIYSGQIYTKLSSGEIVPVDWYPTELVKSYKDE